MIDPEKLKAGDRIKCGRSCYTVQQVNRFWVDDCCVEGVVWIDSARKPRRELHQICQRFRLVDPGECNGI